MSSLSILAVFLVHYSLAKAAWPILPLSNNNNNKRKKKKSSRSNHCNKEQRVSLIGISSSRRTRAFARLPTCPGISLLNRHGRGSRRKEAPRDTLRFLGSKTSRSIYYSWMRAARRKRRARVTNADHSHTDLVVVVHTITRRPMFYSLFIRQ